MVIGIQNTFALSYLVVPICNFNSHMRICILYIFHLWHSIFKLDRFFILLGFLFHFSILLCVCLLHFSLFYGGSQVNLPQGLLGSEIWASSGPCVWVYGCFSPMGRTGNLFDSFPFLLLFFWFLCASCLHFVSSFPMPNSRGIIFCFFTFFM